MVKMNTELLKQLCNEFTVEVPFNGILPFVHKIIDANKLLERIHEVSDLPKEEFIENINSGNFIDDKIKDIFHNIKHQGMFRMFGHEALGNHSYIECKSLKWL